MQLLNVILIMATICQQYDAMHPWRAFQSWQKKQTPTRSFGSSDFLDDIVNDQRQFRQQVQGNAAHPVGALSLSREQSPRYDADDEGDFYLEAAIKASHRSKQEEDNRRAQGIKVAAANDQQRDLHALGSAAFKAPKMAARSQATLKEAIAADILDMELLKFDTVARYAKQCYRKLADLILGAPGSKDVIPPLVQELASVVMQHRKAKFPMPPAFQEYFDLRVQFDKQESTKSQMKIASQAGFGRSIAEFAGMSELIYYHIETKNNLVIETLSQYIRLLQDLQTLIEENKDIHWAYNEAMRIFQSQYTQQRNRIGDMINDATFKTSGRTRDLAERLLKEVTDTHNVRCKFYDTVIILYHEQDSLLQGTENQEPESKKQQQQVTGIKRKSLGMNRNVKRARTSGEGGGASSSSRLTLLQAQIKKQCDLKRQLALLSKYREEGAILKTDELTSKWSNIAIQAARDVRDFVQKGRDNCYSDGSNAVKCTLKSIINSLCIDVEQLGEYCEDEDDFI
ncbi:hypothetical protein MP228_009176 [Amoeboaphelidium protococcarum]|nr:hypothetical protein MP228_009176 [Amoeboaphelidium protococcarum]